MMRAPPSSLLRQHAGILLAALLAAVVVAAVFSPGLGGGFLLDDSANIANNVSLYMTGLDHVSAWRAASSYPYGPGLRLLPMLSFGLDYFRTGSFDPVAYKATNLAIHLVTFFVLTAFLRRLLIVAGRDAAPAGWLGLAVAMLWAIHPLQVSSVLYVVQRMQTLATLFLLLALWAYLTMRQAQRGGQPWGRAGRWAVVFWALALISKEDAALLPAYALALELTVLGFAARNLALARWIKRGYAASVMLGGLVFACWALPHFGSWETFPWRDFNSYERVLTQGRILLMYLGQIVWPLPDNMPFYYDNYVVSRGWLEPASTLMAWLSLTGLAALAWWMRHRRPLFALGLLWFLAGHVVTSNVLGLELAFEHRNHFPMIGILLAVVDGGVALTGALRCGKPLSAAALGLALIGCATGTYVRATVWGNELDFARKSVEIAPTSGRAWLELCNAHFRLSHSNPANPEFGRAIAACREGGERTGSVPALANLVIMKAMRGDVTRQDWEYFREHFRDATLTPENMGTLMNLISDANADIGLDPEEVLATIDLVGQRGLLLPMGNAKIGRFILERTKEPERAYPYLERAVRGSRRDDPLVSGLLMELKAKGRSDWAQRLESGQARQ